jgi:translation initiation factor 2 alpha subunit (eIF-2alpha)
MVLDEGDLVLGTVERITNTIIFVKLPDGSEGTIVSSEIAPGRIKNMRQYVVPKKKIVCKVLRVDGKHINLSLRRVNSKEKKEVMQLFKQEQTSKSAIHSILKEDAKKTEEKILKDFDSLFDFFIKAKEEPKLIEKYIPKKFQEAIKKITEKKQKKIELNQIIFLKCLEDDGIKRLGKIFPDDKELKTTYLSAGKFKIKLTADNYKIGNKKMQEILKMIEENSKANKCEFSSEEVKAKSK